MTELRVTVPDEIAERLATEAAERGTSAEDVAAEVLRLHVPPTHGGHRHGFIGIARAKPGALSVAEAERRLEDLRDEEFAR
jgi:plasmid stability protein